MLLIRNKPSIVPEGLHVGAVRTLIRAPVMSRPVPGRIEYVACAKCVFVNASARCLWLVHGAVLHTTGVCAPCAGNASICSMSLYLSITAFTHKILLVKCVLCCTHYLM